MTIGKGTKAGKALRGYIEEIEVQRERKKLIGEQEKEIFQRAKAEGFDVPTMRKLVTLRKKDLEKRRTEDALLDTYMLAMGMAEDVPAFAALAAFDADITVRENVVEHLKDIVPPDGEIIFKLGGAPVRIYRDGKGKAKAVEVAEPEPSIEPAPPSYAADDEDVSRLPEEEVEDAKKRATKIMADRAESAARRKRETV